MSSSEAVETKYLEVVDERSKELRYVAYQQIKSKSRKIGLVFIPGFMATMGAIIPQALLKFCLSNDFSLTRYEATGLGKSHPIELKNARLSHWIQDAKEVLSRLCLGTHIIITSSMGAWITTYLSLKYPELFGAILYLSPSLNSTKRYEAFPMRYCTPDMMVQWKNGEVVELDTPIGKQYSSLDFIKDMRHHELDLKKGLDINVPVRIIQGIEDAIVPYGEALTLLNSLRTNDAQLTYVKNAKHILEEEDNLQLIFENILKLYSVLDKQMSKA